MSDLLLLELPVHRTDTVRWLRWDSAAGRVKDRGELAVEDGLSALAAHHSDAACYGGSGQGNLGGLEADTVPRHRHPQSIELRVPPLSTLILEPTGRTEEP